MAGAIIAAWLLKLLMSSGYDVGNLGATLGAYTNPTESIVAHPFLALGLEIIATFFLMFVIMGTAVTGGAWARAPRSAASASA